MVMELLKRHGSLIGALVFATITSIGIFHYLEGHESVSTAAPAEMIPVVVARQNLEMGRTLTEADLEIQDWPSNLANRSYFRKKHDIQGRMLRQAVNSGEPLSAHDILTEEEKSRIQIPQNMRGIAVTVRRSKALSDALQVGSILDVISIPADGDPGMSRVIAHAAKVLSIESEPRDMDRSRPSETMEVLLMVKSREARHIAYAVNHGQIELVMTHADTPLLEIV